MRVPRSRVSFVGSFWEKDFFASASPFTQNFQLNVSNNYVVSDITIFTKTFFMNNLITALTATAEIFFSSGVR